VILPPTAETATQWEGTTPVLTLAVMMLVPHKTRTPVATMQVWMPVEMMRVWTLAETKAATKAHKHSWR
jgi:hypothetical protein